MCTAAYLDLEKMIQSYNKSPSLNLDVKRLETQLAELPDEMKMESANLYSALSQEVAQRLLQHSHHVFTTIKSFSTSNINRINTPPPGQPFMAILAWVFYSAQYTYCH